MDQFETTKVDSPEVYRCMFVYLYIAIYLENEGHSNTVVFEILDNFISENNVYDEDFCKFNF